MTTRTERSTFNTLRSEVRAIVDAAKSAGKPINSMLIWGLLKHEVPESCLATEMSRMVKRGELVKIKVPKEVFGRSTFVYEPGPAPVIDGKRQEGISRSLGNMAHRRLVDARAAARKWTLERAHEASTVSRGTPA